MKSTAWSKDVDRFSVFLYNATTMMLIALLLVWCSMLKIEGSSTTGLENFGSTCYANTALQSVASLPETISIIMQADTTHLASDAHRRLLLHLQTILYAMRNGRQLSSNYLHAFWIEVAAEIGWSDRIFTQEDSSSFYNRFTETITEKLLVEKTRLENFESIFKLFLAFKTRYDGVKIVESYEPSFQILLRSSQLKEHGAVPSLHKSLLAEGLFTAFEDDKTISRRSFPGCAPSVLRAEIRRTSDGSSKDTTAFEFPTEFDLAQYMEVVDDKKGFEGRCKKKKSDDDKFIYKLYVVAVHSGSSVKSGHYYCYRRETNGQWFELNDSRVSLVTEDVAVKSNFGGTASAATLMYVREDEIDRVLKSKINIPVATMEAIEQELASMNGIKSGKTTGRFSSFLFKIIFKIIPNLP